MESFFGFLFLGLVIISSVTCNPKSERDDNALETVIKSSDAVNTNTVIGEAISVTDVPITSTAGPETTTVTSTSSGSCGERERLRRNLFANYDRKIHPDNLTVQLGAALIHIDIDETKSSLESGIWLRYVWNDARLVWDEADYDGISILRLDSDDVWKPDITLYNSVDQRNMIQCWRNSNVLIYPNGEILWVPPCHASSLCDLKLEESPYGEQTCKLKFGSWTFDGNTMDLQFYKSIEKLDMSDFCESPKWEVVSHTANRTNKFYACCAEPYPDITYTLVLKRRRGVACSTKSE